MENVTADTNEDAKNLLASQFSHLWNELVTKRLRVEQTEAARIIARTTERLGNVERGALTRSCYSVGFRSGRTRPLTRIADLFDASFDAFCSAVLNSIHTSRDTLDIALTFRVFTSTFVPDTHAGQKTRAVVEVYIRMVIEALETALDSSDQAPTMNTAKDALAALAKFMDTISSSLFDNEPFASRIDAIFVAHPVALLQVSTQGVLAYLRHRSMSSDQSQGELQTQAFWTVLLGALASSPTNVALSLLSPLADAPLPAHLRGTNAAMDELVERLVSNAITMGTQGNEEILVARVLGTPGTEHKSSILGLRLKYRYPQRHSSHPAVWTQSPPCFQITLPLLRRQE